MGILKKMFEKNEMQGRKIKIKFIEKADKPDEHEKFLKPEPMIVKVSTPAAEEKKPEKKAPARKSEVTVVKKTASAEKKAADTQKAKKSEKKDGSKTKPDSKSNKKSAGAATEKKAKKPVKKTEEKSAKKVKTKTSAKVVADEDDAYTKGAVTVSEGKETGVGKFDIQRAKDGRFFFNLYASNHVVIAYSQIYSSTSAAMTGIKSIIANAATTPIEDTTLKAPKTYPFPKWEIYIDKAGEYRFRLYATNGLCVCHSAHGYSTKTGCKGGIESIGRFASEAAKIDKSYLK